MKKTKKVIGIVMAFTMILSLFSLPQVSTKGEMSDNTVQGKCGKTATWEYDEQSSILTISGSGTVTSVDAKDLKSKAKKLIIKKGVTTIGEYAFASFAIEEVVFEEGLKTIKKSAFYECNITQNIVIPKTVENIERCAFFIIKPIEKFTILGDVSTPEDVFGGNVPKIIELGGKCPNFGAMVSSEMSSMPQINLIQSNPYYTIKNGMLLSKDEKVLMYYWGNKNLVLPKSIVKINPYACYNYTLNKVTFNDALTEIGAYAFFYCGLKTITLPKNLITIGKEAFARNQLTTFKGNSKLKKIGTKAFDDNQIAKAKLYSNVNVELYAFPWNAKVEFCGSVAMNGKIKSAKLILTRGKKKGTAKIKIKKAKIADGYQFIFSQKGKKKTVEVLTKKLSISKKLKFAVKYTNKNKKIKQKKNTTVYIKVRPYKVVDGRKVYGKYSKKKAITIYISK